MKFVDKKVEDIKIAYIGSGSDGFSGITANPL